MKRRRNHPLIPIVVWLGVALACCLFALVLVLIRTAGQDEQLDRAHTAGMELGQQMCFGFRGELERGQAARPAAVPQPRRGGGLL